MLRKIPLTTAIYIWGVGWGSLGMYRGHKYYTEEFLKQSKRNYLRHPNIYEKPHYYYLSDFAFMIANGSTYIFPFTAPYSFYIESINFVSVLYTLEAKIRGISDDDDEENKK